MSITSSKELRNRLLNGMTIKEFSEILGRNYEGTRAVINRLWSTGVLTKKEDLALKGHPLTIALSNPQISDEELDRLVYPRRKSNIDFVAPDLTPRIREVVDLRLAGDSIVQIAEKTGLSKVTVGLYLNYARHPEKFIRSTTRRGTPDISPSIDFVNKLLERDGFVLSNISKIARFNDVYKYFNRTETAKCASFSSQKKYFGSLASAKAIYRDKARFVDFLAKQLFIEIFTNFRGFGPYKKGISYSIRGFNYALSEIFVSDKEVASSIWIRIKQLGVKTEGNKIEPIISLTESEKEKMKQILEDLHTSITTSSQLYKGCKSYTNFLERLARKYGFEPTNVRLDRNNWHLRRIV